MSSSSSDWTITLVAAATGQSESIPVPSSTSVADLASWAKALFGLDDVVLFRDGSPLTNTSSSLEVAGCQNGDLLAVQVRKAAAPAPARPPQQSSSSIGGLDFSNLLGQAPAAAAAPSTGGLNFSSLFAQAPSSSSPPEPVYWNGMDVNDAMQYNPHPHAFISLLRSKDHLLKELNYHNPHLVSQIRDKSLDDAVHFWRNNLVESGIKNAMRITQTGRKESDMKERRAANPDDAEAKEYFKAKERKGKVHEQYEQMTNDYPEALGQVLMLYVNAKINDHPIQAFCDSGAQATIMSLRVAKECGLEDYIDTRFQGIAKGVGTGKIVGRIHMVQLQIGSTYFPCSVTVMDDTGSGSDMPFLFGLDMMKRHLCNIDLEKGVLKFRLAPGQYMETPFLHEKDLDEAQGGTKGFSAEAANLKLLEAMDKQRKKQEEGGNAKEGDDGDDDEDMLT